MVIYEVLKDRLQILWKHQRISELQGGRGRSENYLYEVRDLATEDMIHGTREVREREKTYWAICKAALLEKVSLGSITFKFKFNKYSTT